jgi:predicted GTPase
VLPAVGYSHQQLDDLTASIRASTAEVVVSGTPADLARLIDPSKPIVRARYEFAEVGSAGLWRLVQERLGRLGLEGEP